ncbi:MAG: ABC transporter permease [Magnetovibrio sp.]|jgi:iron(III) transport system permease protein|nr:ABC transporter permease [Magnetovibrio sp.]
MLIIALFLLIFLVYPVVQVIFVAFMDGSTGEFTLINFKDFFSNALFRESFWNSMYVGFMSVLLASIYAMPLAYFTSRFEFKGALLIQSLGVIPLIMPPFVGAVAMLMLFGRNGSVNLLLEEWFGINIPFMEGLTGVIFVESLHYFPFILINLSAALNNIDRSMEESAQNLGCSGMRLFRKIVLPLAMPGYVAGASLVFLKVFDDLGTPLLLNVNNMLAPQAYLRIASIGIKDPMGYVISVILVVISLSSMWLAMRTLKGKDYATVQKGGGGLAKRRMRPMEKLLSWIIIIIIMILVLSPHFGLSLLSFGTIWSFSVFPDAFTVNHFVSVMSETPEYMTNTVLYSFLAASIDVIVATAIAYLVLRTKLLGRKLLDYTAMAAVAIPGLVIGIGYLRSFHTIQVPFLENQSMATWWFVIVLALAIRRLPYAMRACTAALQQVSVSLEESAENLGANKLSTIRKIVVPLMLGGILAGFVTSFATAAVELGMTLMLVSKNSDGPLSYGIYVYMQSAAGRGPGAALGIMAVVVVGLCTMLSYLIIEKRKKKYGMGQTNQNFN